MDIIIIVPLSAKAWLWGPCLFYRIKWEKTVPNNWVSLGSYQRLGLWPYENTCFTKMNTTANIWGQLQLKRKWVIFYRKHKINFKEMYPFSMGLIKEMWLVISNMYFKCYLNAWWLLKMFSHQWFREVNWGRKDIYFCT